jgi:Rrf2 family transcriptional regulator, cysteine metabolism repressor
VARSHDPGQRPRGILAAGAGRVTGRGRKERAFCWRRRFRYNKPVISVTSKSRYAVVAMAELARSGNRPVPIAQVAERRGMPVQFLEQLFTTLRRDGLLQSHRGVKGGYTLARPPEDINVLEVVQSLDGRLGEEGKEAGGIWAEGVEALREVFRSTTIADIARREAEEAGAGMYHI